jgi:predicted RNA-binding Zn-ribbon protein involved in translation (DUF1610 family)
MKATTYPELIKKYTVCPKCGSDKIGNEEGSVEIHNKTFKRTCKCGWKIEVKED